MTVHGDGYLIFLGEWRDPLGRAQRRGCGDERDSERLGHLEAAVNLIVSEIVIEAQVVGLQFDPGGVELFADVFEMIKRDRQSPLARLFLPFARRFASRRILSAPHVTLHQKNRNRSESL